MRRLLGWGLVLALAAAWFVVLRPAPLGGPAAYVVVSGDSMRPGLAPGALVVARRQRTYEVGQVIVYRVPKGDAGAGIRVIHRIIGGSPSSGFITKGDNREHRDRWRPRPRDIEGAKLGAVPGAGRAMTLAGTPVVFGGLLAVLVFLSFGDQAVPARWRGDGGDLPLALASAAPVLVVAEAGGVAAGTALAATPWAVCAQPAPAPAAAAPIVGGPVMPEPIASVPGRPPVPNVAPPIVNFVRPVPVRPPAPNVAPPIVNFVRPIPVRPPVADVARHVGHCQPHRVRPGGRRLLAVGSTIVGGAAVAVLASRSSRRPS